MPVVIFPTATTPQYSGQEDTITRQLVSATRRPTKPTYMGAGKLIAAGRETFQKQARHARKRSLRYNLLDRDGAPSADSKAGSYQECKPFCKPSLFFELRSKPLQCFSLVALPGR